jgi:hypothetical protein
MRWFGALRQAWRSYSEARERELRRLRRMYVESERLRAELSHLEREIHELQASPLPRRQKELLESAIRVRFRKVETEMLHRQNEVLASGHVVSPW